MTLGPEHVEAAEAEDLLLVAVAELADILANGVDLLQVLQVADFEDGSLVGARFAGCGDSR